MCEAAAQMTQEQAVPAGRERDVDDLIFADVPEWLVSER